MNSKVSIIVPNYNHAIYLKQRIDSILNQTFQNFELILLDDCSTDNSWQILSEYERHPKVSHCLRNEQNSGSPFLQWQKGIEMARGEYIWIAESDDWAESGLLSRLCSLLDLNPLAGLAYCNGSIYHNDLLLSDFATEKEKKWKSGRWNSDYMASGTIEINEALLWDCTINNASGVLMRKSVLKETMPNLTPFNYSGDWFCYLRIAAISDIAYCATALNNYRDHDTNTSKKSGYSYIIELFRIYTWLLKSAIVPDRALLFRAFHSYISDVYSTGLKWSLLRDYRVLRPIHNELYLRMSLKLLKRKIRRILSL